MKLKEFQWVLPYVCFQGFRGKDGRYYFSFHTNRIDWISKPLNKKK